MPEPTPIAFRRPVPSGLGKDDEIWRLDGTSFCLGRSDAFRKALTDLRAAAELQICVLFEGESGTGKELFARALHALGRQCRGPFVPVDCAALPRELLERELFGNARGAFTGAVLESQGLVAAADGGTLFLDEIANLDFEQQATLLRLLDRGEYRRIGDPRLRRLDARVVAACNVELRTAVAEGRFRSDLYFRLAEFPIRTPPLRERREDLPRLINHLIAERSFELAKEPPRLAPCALNALYRRPWPGNVRELRNVLTQLVVRFSGAEVHADRLPAASNSEDGSKGASPAAFAAPPFEIGKRTFQSLKSEVIERFERSYLTQLLSTYRGNLSAAARAAGKNRRALWELLHKHGLDAHDFRLAPDGSGRTKTSH